MTDEEKQTALEKHRTLLLATLDYHLENYTGSIVFDDWDPAADFYLQEKQETEKDYQEFRLEMLQQRLGRYFRRLRDRTDLNFESYIRKQTGYEIDIFEDLRRDVATIVSRGIIENEEALRRVASLIRIYESNSAKKEQSDQLLALVDAFTKRNHPGETFAEAGISEVKHVIVQIQPPPPGHKSTAMTDIDTTSRIISEAEYATFQRNNGLLFESRSPDSFKQIITRTNGIENNAVTEVSIVLKGGSGCVIETKKEYLAEIKHHTIRSFEDIVKIEYIDRSTEL